MKKLITYTFFLILITSYSYAQSGWFWQNPLPSIHFRKVEFINDQTGFIGGGGYIIKTTNGGITWFWIMGGACSFDLDFVDNSLGYSVDRYCGLYKTTNSGQNWEHLFSSSEFMNPRVYFLNAQTGVMGVGYNDWDNLYKTINGGITWTHPNVPSGMTSPIIQSIHFPTDNVGYACGGFMTVIRTSDQGNNWVNRSLGAGYFLNALYFTSSDTGYVVGGVFNLMWRRIVKTTNGGIGWFDQTPPLGKAVLNDVKFLNSNIGYIAGDSGYVIKTENAGSNWFVSFVGPNVSLKSIDFIDNSKVIAVGSEGSIYLSTNQGLDYVRKSYSMSDTLSAVYFVDSLIGYAVGYNGLILKDSCGFWLRVNWKPGKIFTSVFFNNYLTGFCSATDGRVYKTTNGGYAWEETLIAANLRLNNVKFFDLNTGFVAGNTGRCFRTTDAGQTWTGLVTSTNLNLNKITILDSIQVMIVGDNGLVLKSTDSGLNWTILPAGQSKKLNSIFSLNSSLQYIVGDSSTCLKTTNGGVNWQTVPLPTITYDLNDVFFVNISTGYITGDQGKLLKTTNAGLNWGFQTSGVSNNLNGLNFINSSTGFVVGDNGVIRKTTNGGGNVILSVSGVLSSANNFSLSQNYPNPFNPQTKIRFDVPANVKGQTSNVKLVIYDLLGREVATLVNEELKPGSYEADWDGSNYSSGVYFYKIITNNFTETRKMVLMR